MARLLHSSGASSSPALRRWLAQYLEGRRRRRLAAAIPSGPQPPNPPVNLVGTSSGDHIELSWNDMSTDELGFRVYRKVDPGGYGLLQSLGPGATGAQDYDVVFAQAYRYYVVAFNAVGESAQSNEELVVFGV